MAFEEPFKEDGMATATGADVDVLTTTDVFSATGAVQVTPPSGENSTKVALVAEVPPFP